MVKGIDQKISDVINISVTFQIYFLLATVSIWCYKN